MTIDRKTQDDWNDCPQGELSRMVQRLDVSRARAKTKKLYQIGLLSMLLVASGVVVVGSFTAPSGFSYGGITCTECRGHFAVYHDHMTGSKSLEDSSLEDSSLEDSGLLNSLATHLAHCEVCQKLFNQTYPGVLENAGAVATRPAMGRLLPLLAMSRQPAFY